MADEPSARAVWNVRAFVGFTILAFSITLTCWGLAIGALTWQEAALPWIGAGIGSGATWFAAK